VVETGGATVVEEEGTGSFGEIFLEGTSVVETGGARVVETGGADGCETREAGSVETGGVDGTERGETTVVEEEEEETGNLGGRNTLGVSVVEMGKTDG
jgi:hypothetical protein